MKLFRRNPENPNCAWSVRFSVRNKIYPFSTQTTDKALALIRAKDYRNKIVAGEYGLADGMKARSGCPTFAELFKAYNDLPEPSPLTRKRNIASMKAVLAASKLDETARLDKLCSNLAITYRDAMLKARPGCPAAKVSANSAMRRSRSLFSKDAMLSYKPVLTVPVEAVKSYFELGFLEEPELAKAMPTAEAMAAAELALKDHPWHYRAYLLARYGGCRAGEILHARRDWIDGNRLTIGDSLYTPKSGKRRTVTLPEQAVAVLLAGDDLYLAGPRRKEIVAWELNAMLKKAGFTDPKPLHSLRRLFGSLLFSHQSPAIAQAALGHSSLTVTQDHYATLLTQQKAVEWAG